MREISKVLVQPSKQRDGMVAEGHLTAEVQGEEGTEGQERVPAAERGGQGKLGHGLNGPQRESLGDVRRRAMGLILRVHIYVCVNVWIFWDWEAIQGLQEMEGVRISASDIFAKGFWESPSRLVEYSCLDHVGVITQVRKIFFPSGKFGMAFLRGKEGRKKGREDRRVRSTYSIL